MDRHGVLRCWLSLRYHEDHQQSGKGCLGVANMECWSKLQDGEGGGRMLEPVIKTPQKGGGGGGGGGGENVRACYKTPQKFILVW